MEKQIKKPGVSPLKPGPSKPVTGPVKTSPVKPIKPFKK
jgi:hypothetical protein